MEVTEENIVDESLYSRQLYVIGNDAMKSLSDSVILLLGIGGLGSEIAKNLVLMGVKRLFIIDNKPTSLRDVGINCFLAEEDVNNSLTRATAACPRIQELNSYVNVTECKDPLTITKEYFEVYSCVILTETNLKLCFEIDNLCRSLNSPVKVIMADVYGLVSWVFCDFGPVFEITDTDGEEVKEITVIHIEKGLNGNVTVSQNHNFETGDSVWFTDILGMEELNNTTHKIKVISPKAFTFDLLRHDINLGNYIRGGLCKLVKQPVKVTFNSLETEIWNPNLENIDSLETESAKKIHLGLVALHNFLETHKQLPRVCNLEDASEFLTLSQELYCKLKGSLPELDEEFINKVALTSNGQLPAICAFLGGVIAQETVKAVTGKFTPLAQWLHFDAIKLTDINTSNIEKYVCCDTRYDAIQSCLGKDTLDYLSDCKIFMIGCGAIGCEMLKNYAMLGIGTRNGNIVVTDHDMIEKSNLNRQFLFRSHHIQKSKSSIAASSILHINPDLKITAHQTKVCPDSENIYNEEFLELQNVIVNALDNLEARRYIDSRCVLVNKPLLESGTMGCKGHVQVILPHLTENYTAQSDPLDNDYPYCTIKSFPTQIEHTAQWAKEKFYSLFELKPFRCLKFLRSYDMSNVMEKLISGEKVEGCFQVTRDLVNRPRKFSDCLLIARLKFEKYFNHKAKNLLHFFPEDKVIEDGNVVMPFWHSPRRPPQPIEFDISNELHYLFVISMAKLLALAWRVPQTNEIDNKQTILKITIPKFEPKDDQVVVTDESVVAPDPMQIDCDEDLNLIAKELEEAVKELKSPDFNPINYDKDLDSHLDFVHSATNLRAAMYKLPIAPRLRIKQITGRIIPAIASTTSSIAGLVTIELIKVLKQMNSRNDYRNWFINLAISNFVSAEPAPPEKMKIGPVTYTAWDKWCIYGKQDVTLQQVLQMALEKCKLKPSMIVQGARIVWWPILPGHNNRVFKKFKELINIEPNAKFVDLSFTFEVENDNDVAAPLIRLFFQD